MSNSDEKIKQNNAISLLEKAVYSLLRFYTSATYHIIAEMSLSYYHSKHKSKSLTCSNKQFANNAELLDHMRECADTETILSEMPNELQSCIKLIGIQLGSIKELAFANEICLKEAQDVLELIKKYSTACNSDIPEIKLIVINTQQEVYKSYLLEAK